MLLVDSKHEAISNRDSAMLSRAAEIAKTSTVKQKHGAILYKSGRVLAVGINSLRNEHPTMEIDYEHYTYHAEHATIRAALNEDALMDSTLYVARVNRLGNPMHSFPCRDCIVKIMTNGIKRVVFT